MIESRISCYFYNELFSESNKEKCTAFQGKAWSLIPLLLIKILLKTAQLLSKHFPSGLSLFVFSISSKYKYTFAILQPSVQHLVYVFPILPPWHKGVVGFSLMWNNTMRSKTNRFLFVLTDNHTEIWDIIFSAIKNERSHLCD